jgi:hypothetical protein
MNFLPTILINRTVRQGRVAKRGGYCCFPPTDVCISAGGSGAKTLSSGARSKTQVLKAEHRSRIVQDNVFSTSVENASWRFKAQYTHVSARHAMEELIMFPKKR